MPEQGVDTEPFAVLLRRLRERAGLTQQELAERAALTPHAVSALERGTRTRPYPHTVRALADALGATDEDRATLIASVPRRPGGAGRGPLPDPQPGPPRPRGLAAPVTTLYGREHDVARAAYLIRSGTRLLTLTGPGGVGKTRLAIALSEELRQDFPGGVIQISLAPLADATDVMGTIGRALGVVGSDGDDAIDTVVAHLSGEQVLLVLDNFEHLLSAAAEIARLCALCPDLAVLVSSRSPLRVRGEREYAVDPLLLPSPDVRNLNELAAAPAGALALDRARALMPDEDLSGEDVVALAQLCHRLSGLPLAIELATAHLRMLDPHTLLERLDDLWASAGDRDLPERQRTMRTTLDWSLALLSPDEQRLFRLLGVFRGGGTLEAVEAVVCADGFTETVDVVGLLGRLVEHSLVLVRTGVDGQRRFDQLEPIAQYARSQLVGEEARSWVRAHAGHYLRLTQRAAVGFERADQTEWLARTEADEANLLVAVDRALDTGDGNTAGGITWALWLYWWLRGQSSIGRRRAEQCLGLTLPPTLEARVHLTAATMSYAAGDAAAAAGHWRAALARGVAEDDPEVLCKATAGVGLAALSADDTESAITHFREALEYGARAGEAGVWLRSLTHVWLGTVLILQQDYENATVEIERGMDLARGRGDRLPTYVALHNLSVLAIAQGDHGQAREYLDEGIRLSEETQDKANLAYFLEALAVVESFDGRSSQVARLLGAVHGLRQDVGSNVYAYYRPDESLRAEAEAAARDRLGTEAFDAAFVEGARLGLTELTPPALPAGE
ncbi:helix-turn-helix domain-containing protein [Nostocoides sp. F2B08]|uniref:ATP-binding protein n=1 Tax=Nostocoides sp. F2B08 TaxID=2653936 RepID=UPI00126337C6|nr:helix-turn-helix domain-containing protein [Tetrasphaera sp. F2B08]KAB7741008.1 helix-turn-helix domain-containing protein [Tetrasphaera sp. F2B08]